MDKQDPLALIALLVAVLAMLSTVWQAAIARRHNRLCVRPVLDWGRNRTTGDRLTLEFVNNGIGTAIVKKLWLTYGDKKFPIDRLALPPLIKAELDKCPIYVRWMVLTPDSPLKVEQVFRIFDCQPLPNATEQEQHSVIAFMDRIGFVIEYECLYEQPFTLTCPQNYADA